MNDGTEQPGYEGEDKNDEGDEGETSALVRTAGRLVRLWRGARP